MSDPILLVTGASGLLGQAFIERVHDRYHVVGFDVVEAPESSPVEVRYMDVTSDMSVRDALGRVEDEEGRGIAAVVHLAAYYDFSGEDSPLYDQITVQGTKRLLEYLADFDLERFVFSSTMLVHDAVKPGEHIREDSPLRASWPYPQSKIETEKLVIDHESKVPHTLLRLAGVYDEWGTQPTLVEQIRRIFEQDLKGFFFPGDSEAGQSIVHLDDAVDALARTVHRRGELDDGPILVGEPEPMGYAELQDRIGTLIWGTDWPTIRVPEPAAKAAAWAEDQVTDAFIKPYMIEMADDHYALDISRARSWLEWSPDHRLDDEMERIIGRLKENPVRWYEENDLDISDEAVVESLGA
ncbi:MAG: NAD(P)-dependent oxidoreductase [Longimicrobiales bacterium]|nr:NAD(P)-dependent oxidoreductase [Longimicrobiales bacterium]